MHIVIPDEYQDAIERLACYGLLDGHDVTRYREPAGSFDELVARLLPADVIVAIRERVRFDRALIERLPNLKLIALVGRNATTIDYAACTEHGVMVSRGESNSPTSPAELTVSLMLASRRNIVIEERNGLRRRRISVHAVATGCAAPRSGSSDLAISARWWPRPARVWECGASFWTGTLRPPCRRTGLCAGA